MSFEESIHGMFFFFELWKLALVHQDRPRRCATFVLLMTLIRLRFEWAFAGFVGIPKNIKSGNLSGNEPLA